MIEQQDCPICLGPLDINYITTPCDHHFCFYCFTGHLTSGNNFSKKCPCCREILVTQRLQLDTSNIDSDDENDTSTPNSPLPLTRYSIFNYNHSLSIDEARRIIVNSIRNRLHQLNPAISNMIESNPVNNNQYVDSNTDLHDNIDENLDFDSVIDNDFTSNLIDNALNALEDINNSLNEQENHDNIPTTIVTHNLITNNRVECLRTLAMNVVRTINPRLIDNISIQNNENNENE